MVGLYFICTFIQPVVLEPLLNVSCSVHHQHILTVNGGQQTQTFQKCRDLCLIINVISATKKKQYKDLSQA